MPEREQLVKKVFPRIRAAARERGVEFTEIDLRWGITDDETKAGKTISICLEEIDKCSPYFIGIMGSRYGYVPGLEALDLDPELIKKYPWIREQAAAGNSITEMEFYEGAILRSAKASAFIYDQSEKLYSDGPADLEKLSALKEKIVAANVLLRDFSTPEELGEQVLADLLAILERDWPVETNTDELSATRQTHEAFALNRQRSYVADPYYEELFENFINAESEPFVICARSGLGKSSLLAHLLRDYKRKHPEAFVVGHFIGAGSSASTAFDFMRHVMLEIKHRYALSDEVPIDSTKILEEFPNWLARLQNEKLILGVDAVNQLTGIDKELNWLPQFIPAAVRLIITTTPEETAERLRSRSWQLLELQPITAGTRANITRTYLERYRKVLPVALFERVTSDEKTSSPLFLRTFLEEIRIFGEHSNLKNEIERYLSSAGEGELFQNVLLRMERDHGEETVRRIMTGIWASRYGLSETELLGFTGLTRVELSTLLISLEYHLMQRGGLHTFFHAFLREAVEIRYLQTEEAKTAAHNTLGDYFSHQEPSKRRADEEPHQWLEAKNTERIMQMFADPDLFLYLTSLGRPYELLGYWTKANANEKMVDTYKMVFQYANEQKSIPNQIKLFTTLGSFLIAASKFDLAEVILEKSVGLCIKEYGDTSRETANALRELATVYLFTSRSNDAIRTYEKNISILENLGDDKELSETQSNLAAVYLNTGEYDLAISLQRSALSTAINAFGRNNPIIAEHMNNLASFLYRKKELQEAQILWTEAIKIDFITRGEFHSQTLKHQMNLAVLFGDINETEKALEIYNVALAILIKSLGEQHTQIAFIYSKQSRALLELGRFEEARKACYSSIKLTSLLLGENNIKNINNYLLLGLIEFKAQNYSSAEYYYSTYIPIKISLLGEQHPGILTSINNYLQILKKAGRIEEYNVIKQQYSSTLLP